MRDVYTAEMEEDVRTTTSETNLPAQGAHFSDAPSSVSSGTRRTVEPVDRLAEDEAEAQITYTHDSAYHTTSFAPIREAGYRKSRSDMSRLQKGLRYGQYLELPKGRRSIFRSQQRTSIFKTAAAVVLGFALLVGLAYLLWELIGKLF